MKDEPEIDRIVDRVFRGACKSIRREDELIQKHVLPCADAGYAGWDPGMIAMYETCHVYNIIKELWNAGFEYPLAWEHAYPEGGNLQLDLGIFLSSKHSASAEFVDIAIEAKFFRPENSKLQAYVWTDILKLLRYFPAKERLLLLISAANGPNGNLDAAIEELLNRDLKVGKGTQHYKEISLLATDYLGWTDEGWITFAARQFISVDSVKTERFQTYIKNEPQPVEARVDLIQVLPRGPISAP
jgi:hypothetical protein